MKRKNLENFSVEELKEGLDKLLNKKNKNSKKKIAYDTCYEIFKNLLQKKDEWNEMYELLYQKAERGELDYKNDR